MLRTRELMAIAVVAVGALAGSAIAEDVTVTSYFPSPTGNFDQLTSASNSSFATGSLGTPGVVQVGVNAAPTAATSKFQLVNGGASVALGGTLAAPAAQVLLTAAAGTDPIVRFNRAATAASSISATGNDILKVSGAELHVGNTEAGAGTGHVRITGAFYCSQAVDVSEQLAIGASQLGLVAAGHVMTVNPNADESMVLSRRPYDPSVVGVISTQPGMLLGAEREGMSLALTGRVPTKVTAENGPIHRGDLLVTASKAGYAMRGDPDRIRSGMVIGKALGELESGEGEIVVLVNLQ